MAKRLLKSIRGVILAGWPVIAAVAMAAPVVVGLCLLPTYLRTLLLPGLLFGVWSIGVFVCGLTIGTRLTAARETGQPFQISQPPKDLVAKHFAEQMQEMEDAQSPEDEQLKVPWSL